MSETEEATEVHSVENTRAVAEDIQQLLREDDEGDLSPYDKINVVKTAVSFRVENQDTELEYTVTITPFVDSD